MIVAMREKLHGIATAEMDRYRGRLGPLSENQESTVRELLSSVVQKILHGPIRQVKRAAGAKREDATLDVVKLIFDLEVEQERGNRPGGGAPGGVGDVEETSPPEPRVEVPAPLEDREERTRR